jgi:hypothetical protein
MKTLKRIIAVCLIVIPFWAIARAPLAIALGTMTVVVIGVIAGNELWDSTNK